jgi:hypothetical protein
MKISAVAGRAVNAIEIPLRKGEVIRLGEKPTVRNGTPINGPIEPKEKPKG